MTSEGSPIDLSTPFVLAVNPGEKSSAVLLVSVETGFVFVALKAWPNRLHAGIIMHIP